MEKCVNTILLEKHLREEESNEMVSTCCGDDIYEDDEGMELCSACDNECASETRGEYAGSEYQSELEDRADAQRDLEREHA